MSSKLKEPRENSSLTREREINILYSWAYDASDSDVAKEEGMIAAECLHLDEILAGLHELSGSCDVEHSSTTK